jgi:hypothetical protein
MDPTEDLDRCPPQATIEIVNPNTGCPLTGPCEDDTAEDEDCPS